jgi:hypothetical protein
MRQPLGVERGGWLWLWRWTLLTLTLLPFRAVRVEFGWNSSFAFLLVCHPGKHAPQEGVNEFGGALDQFVLETSSQAIAQEAVESERAA